MCVAGRQSIKSKKHEHPLFHKKNVLDLPERQGRIRRVSGVETFIGMPKNERLKKIPSEICEKISRITRLLEQKYEEKLIEKRKIHCDYLEDERTRELKKDLVFIKAVLNGVKDLNGERTGLDWCKIKGKISLGRRKQMKYN